MRPIIVHTTDPELYLILRYVLQQAEHTVEIASSIDGIVAKTETMACKGAAILALPACTLIAAANRLQVHRTHLDLVAFPFAEERLAYDANQLFDFVINRPFEPQELLDFLRSDEVERGDPRGSEIIRFADVQIDVAARRVKRGSSRIELSPLHFRLLQHLAENVDRVVSREDLIDACWPAGANVEPRTVDIHIGRIRHKLCSGGSDLIRTIRGEGYVLE